MGANSSQGIALLVLLVAFTCLGMALLLEGNLLLLLLFVVLFVVSCGLFMKAKPMEQAR